MKNTIMKAFFLVLLKCAVVSCTHRPIIGILAQEFGDYDGAESYTGNGGTYIAASYVKVVESSGARVAPIFVGKPYEYYEQILHSINGVVIPGGAAPLEPSHAFYDAVTIIYKISEQMNDNGIYFPVFAVCLGFEAVLTLYNHHKLLQTSCGIRYENYPLQFASKYTESLMFSQLDEKTYITLKYFPTTLNNHAWCTTLHNFTKSHLSKNWQITSTSVSKKGMKFIATVEHKTYPFIAVQFHPEKVIFEWPEEFNMPHYHAAVQANRYFYDVLIKLSKLNNNKFKNEKEEKDALIYKYKTFYPSEHKPLVFAQIYIFD